MRVPDQPIEGGKQRTSFLIIALLLTNLFVFLRANQVPILWQQGEIPYYNLVYSSDPATRELVLVSGLRPGDFLKIFQTDRMEGFYRSRQFSYLLEMLSLKFWQWTEVVTFRNFTLIGYHLLNVFLVFLVVKRLTGDAKAGILSAVLALNSGIALATLLFPFRNAKLLLTLLFLLAWAFTLKEKGRFFDQPFRRRAPVLVLAVLAFLTDELAVFLFGGLAVYLLLTEKRTPGAVSRGIRDTLCVILLYALASLAALKTATALSREVLLPSVRFQVESLIQYFQSTEVIPDTVHAFLFYFLRLSFGVWDTTVWGTLALGAFLTLMFFIVRAHRLTPASAAAYLLLSIILAKAVLLPHVGNYHAHIMPFPGCFPTILFFSYYYTYPDTLLAAVCLAVLLQPAWGRKKGIYLVLLFCATIINISNYRHGDELIAATRQFHGRYQLHEQTIPRILKIKAHLASRGHSPMYLSFPSGSRARFTRPLAGRSIWENDPEGEQQQLHPDFISYDSLVPVLFLKKLERGELRMSLKTVRDAPTSPPHTELAGCKTFYDVPREHLLRLNDLEGWAEAAAHPHSSQEDPIERTLPLGPPKSEQGRQLVLFVKGAARITLHSPAGDVHTRQRYGNSYQLLVFSLPSEKEGDVRVTIAPVPSGGDFQVVGPFLSTMALDAHPKETEISLVNSGIPDILQN